MSPIVDDIVNEADGAVEILLAGDLILDLPDPDHWLSGIAPALRAADIAIGHLEVPHTTSREELQGDVPAPGADPAHLAALARAGFDAVSLAGNHMADCGPQGIAETVAGLDWLGIAHAGAGADLAAARAPALIERGGRRVALLSYNCVGPVGSRAAADHPGCAWLEVVTADGGPASPAADLVRHTEAAEAILREDIARARGEADLVIVALHKGIVHRPAVLAPYERPLAWAAIDAGADAVVGHHAHIARGIERHRGKPIFHGLGNGCVVTRALSPDQSHPARREWAEKRKRLFGFEPDPAYPFAPFHPEAVNAMLARLVWHADGSVEAGIVPVHVEPPGRPVLAQGERGDAVADYVRRIGATAGLPALDLTRRGDRRVLA
ncbi:CapA family protein [Sphingosinicella terrae]|uniref:CapA family protein n=1 Tax=Sphingosinicella terrae TaxID=2172047 RepID=UPI000E0D13B9|nr:CapA family protein [Sphingosinicella terrae]